MSLPKYLCYPSRQRQAPLSLPCTRMRFGPVCINRPLPMNQFATMALISIETSPARCYNTYVFELASASVDSGLQSMRYPAGPPNCTLPAGPSCCSSRSQFLPRFSISFTVERMELHRRHACGGVSVRHGCCHSWRGARPRWPDSERAILSWSAHSYLRGNE